MAAEEISIDQFGALDIRIAIVKEATSIEGADRLLRLVLDVGDPEQGGLGERIVASGIKQWYAPEDLVGKQVVYLANLAPRMLRGVESQGMILAGGEETAVLLRPASDMPAGTVVH
jgi:methionyl-tRNA synthetase